MSEIIIREIEENDLEKGFLETLDFLRNASGLDKNKARKILKDIKQNSTWDKKGWTQRKKIIYHNESLRIQNKYQVWSD